MFNVLLTCVLVYFIVVDGFTFFSHVVNKSEENIEMCFS